MHAFMLYINDWLSSKNIEMMDAAEERGYLRLLLREAQEHDCGLPDDDAVLAHLSLLGAQWFKVTTDKSKRFGTMTSGQKLRQCFMSMEGHSGRIFNERLLKEWSRHQTICDRNRENGRFGARGGRPKKTHVGYSGDPKETQEGNSGNPKITPPSPSPSTEEENTLFTASANAESNPKKSRKSRLTEKTLPAEWGMWAMGEYGWDSPYCNELFAQFSDHHRSKGNVMSDWKAAWRTWCRNSLRFNNRQTPPAPSPVKTEAHTYWVDPFAHLKASQDSE
jgi:hypothetical protein